MIALYRLRLPSRLRPDALAERLRHRAPQRGLALELRRDEQAERDHFRLRASGREAAALVWVVGQGSIRADAGGSQMELELRPRLLPALGIWGVFASVWLWGWWTLGGEDGLWTVALVPTLATLGIAPAYYQRRAKRMARLVCDLILLRPEEP